jgi:hypothetical protein
MAWLDTLNPTGGGGGGYNPSFEGFDPGAMSKYISTNLLPLQKQMYQQQQPIKQAYLSYLTDPNAGMDALKSTAMGTAGLLFKAGGPIANAIRNARGGMGKSGFNPEGAFGQETGIMQQGIDTLLNSLLTQATGLKEQQFSELGKAYGTGWENLLGGAESIFGAGSNVFGLNLAKQQQEMMNKGIFGSVFGNLI